MLPENFKEQHALSVRSIQWSYAIFWFTSSTQPMVLSWGEGYYNGDIKTRKTGQGVELNSDQIGLQRSEQLRELYKSLKAVEASPQTKRPSAALSPKDLTDTEWYYLAIRVAAMNCIDGLSIGGRIACSGKKNGWAMDNNWRQSSYGHSGSSSSSWNSYPQPAYGQGSHAYEPQPTPYPTAQPYYAPPPPTQNCGHEQSYTSGEVTRPDNRRKKLVTEALARAGLESSNLILGIDFTKSNEWTGKNSFNRKSLHHTGNVPNPYEQAISILEKTLATFDEDNLIPCFGFGDDPTLFAPIVEMAMTIVEQSGGQDQ
ncbi:hypothetical protein S83_063140, partial [Arachis hypogaea]